MTEIVMSQTPPILHGPTEKEKKYDRQLRLWAASGQAALESANILLVNSGSGVVGVEALKNLVLPGIGRFIIADDAVVKEADLGVNFFLDDGCLGKLRSHCSTEFLLELNPEVQGDYFPKSVERLDLAHVLDAYSTFTMIMFTFPIDEKNLAILEAYGREHQTPLVAIHSAGFYSYFKISLPGAFPIVDTHPDESSMTDLRLLDPWPELASFAREMAGDIDNLDNHDHGHLPYVVILLHYLDRWRETHDGKNPTTYAEKVAFRKVVADAARTNNPEGGEENFEEAVSAVLKTVVPTTLPSGLREIFDYRQKMQEARPSSGFWAIADGVKAFYDRHGCLPLLGNVPDMKAQSSVYIQLQNIYKKKARQDAAEVLRVVQASEEGRDIDPEEVDLFCKNAPFVKLINAAAGASGNDRLGAVAAEELANDANAEALMQPLSLLPIYLALQATSHVAAPSNADEITQNIDRVLAGVATDHGANDDVTTTSSNERIRQVVAEVARASGGELHNVSALTGGMVAQEVIKIITKQYVPIDNTCVFDGIGSRCQVLRL